MIELVAVVVIVAVIAGIAVARVSQLPDKARLNAAAADFRAFETALRMYHAEHGAFPPDQVQGVYPPELEGYFDRRTFDREPSLGKKWDWNPTWGPFAPNVSMWAHPRPHDDWVAFDERFDDGNLGTGKVQMKNGRWLCWRVSP